MRFPIVLPAIALLGAAPLYAADQAPPQQPAAWQRPSPAEMEAHRAAMEAARASDVALLLGLHPDQKPALDTYLATMHPHHDRHDGHGFGHQPGDAAAPGSEGTIASLDRMSQRIDARDAEAKQRIEATRRFYATLSHDQQQRFDAMEHLMRDHHGHGWHGHGGHDGAHDMHGMG